MSTRTGSCRMGCAPDGRNVSADNPIRRSALHPSDLPSHPSHRMLLRLIASWLLRPKRRIWVAALCTTVAITASGVPCLCTCLGHAAEPVEHSSPSRCHHTGSNHGGAEHPGEHGGCPPASTCMQDQAPAVSTQPVSLPPSLEGSSPFSGAIVALNTVPSEHSVLLKARASPDRGPPIPTSTFTVLRL
jgi:hypothetical protein